MAVQPRLEPGYTKYELEALKGDRTVNRVTLTGGQQTARPGTILNVIIPKIPNDHVIVPGTLAVRFNLNMGTSDAGNYLVDNVSRALVKEMKIAIDGVEIQTTSDYDDYKTYKDLWLSKEKRDNMLSEGIQSVDQSKVRCGTSGAKTSGVEVMLNKHYSNRYKIWLDDEFVTDNGSLFTPGLGKLTFNITLADGKEVVKGSTGPYDYILENLELEYTTIKNSTLAARAREWYKVGKTFAFEQVSRVEQGNFKDNEQSIFNMSVNPSKSSLKAVLVLFRKATDPTKNQTEEFFNPNFTEVKVTVKGMPNRVYSNGIQSEDFWVEAKNFFHKGMDDCYTDMSISKFYTDKFCILIDLRSQIDDLLHGSGIKTLKDAQGVQFAMKRVKGSSSDEIEYLIYEISDAQVNIADHKIKNHYV
ncbi:MAG: hypothetical protein V6Z82_06780 [Flavobacteriales bacterium]